MPRRSARAQITMMRALCVFLTAVGAVMAGEAAGSEASSSHDRVKVELYMEALCPYCARFVHQTVSKAFENGLEPIMDLELIPWVRARKTCLLVNNARVQPIGGLGVHAPTTRRQDF